ncbi:hypothetical protein B0H19DRAFT_1380945 [Mycena capillaripes]|nr:hypothetical protein B0H19DRAFT_1380945 [Mycena capillaripes]
MKQPRVLENTCSLLYLTCEARIPKPPLQSSPQFSMHAALLTVPPSIFTRSWVLPRLRATRSDSFDPNRLIDVIGAHAFFAAGTDDFPGLNTLANHNYIPHNGVDFVLDAIPVSFKVFGLGADIGITAALYVSNLLDIPFFEFSIGPPPKELGGLGEILQGILGVMMNHSAADPGGIFSPTASLHCMASLAGPIRIWNTPETSASSTIRPVPLWGEDPEALIIGGNLGTVNSFSPNDIRDFTFNVYNPTNLLEGTNAACFAF